MAEVPDQILTNITKALNDINTTLSATKGKGAKAAGTSSGSAVTDSFVQLYKTVSDADNAIQKPFSQAGTALENLGNIAKGALPSWLPFGDEVKGFLGTITKAGKVLADHNQKLLDFSQGLAGSAGLSIDSFTELTKQLSTASIGFEDFRRVQATAANFLSSMGGDLRGAGAQARLLADITNVVNDDFEKLGQMGLSLVEKQSLMADSMDMMRQIGMAAGTDSREAAATVSGAMQRMAMESNKMAALTGKDRRETLAAMAKKVKSDTSVAVSAKMIADQQGLTAEQTANLRTSLAAVETNIENAFPGAMGADMQAAVDMAARTGMDFNTALASLNPQLAAALTKNKEFTNGMDDVVKTLREGGEVDVANLGELNKKFESSVDKNMLTTMQMTKDGAALSTNIYEAMVAINAQSTDAANNVEVESEKLKDSAAGQAANVAQVMKDSLTQAQNVASVFLTISTEVFNQKFAENSKTMRDNIKASGSDLVAGMSDVRDVLMGVRTMSDDTGKSAKELMGYSGEETIAARKKLEAGLAMLGMSKKEQEAWIEAAGLQKVHASRVADEAEKALEKQKAVTGVAQGLLEASKDFGAITESQLESSAAKLKIPVEELKAAIEAERKVGQAIKVVAEANKEAGVGIAAHYDSLSAAQKEQFNATMALMKGAIGSTDAAYDKLISTIIGNNTELGPTNQILGDIKKSDRSNEIVEELIKLNTKGGPSDALNNLSTEIRDLNNFLKKQEGKEDKLSSAVENQTTKLVAAQMGTLQGWGKKLDDLMG